MVTVAVPGVAETFAVKVSTLAPVAGFGLKDAVTPVGRPDAARFALPVNPFKPVTVIVDVTEPPWASAREAGEAPIVKLGKGPTVRTSVAAAVSEPEVPVIVTL
jgi:hypothetical protein